MKAHDQYLKFVRWEEADQLYVGYCPDLFPWGGVCHGETEEETYHQLCALVAEEVDQLRQDGKKLPPATTRAMRDAVPA
jgi:predicted RNase H-like HicB family nuclease